MPAPTLVLALPGLLAADAATSAPAPALARLLAVAGAPIVERDGIGAALAAVYGVARQADWPLAPIRAAACGIDTGAAWWLAADPVTLEAGRDDVRLVGRVTDITPDEAAVLVAMLNAHFGADGLTFVAPRPDAWFVRAAAAAQLATSPPDAALGRTLHARPLTGADSGRWRRWDSEIQMLLHEHPVNVARQRAGHPTLSALWFWGGGTLPAAAPAAVATYADDGIAAALAAHAGRPAAAVPRDLAAVLASRAAAVDTIVCVVESASADVARIEAAWTAPAWAALARRRVARVTVLADGAGTAAVWTARRPSAWQRLAAHVSAPDLPMLLAAARNPEAAR